MCRLGIKDFVTSFNSIMALIVLIFLIVYVYYAANVVVEELERDLSESFV